MHQSEPGRADCDDHPSARMLGAEVRPAAMSLAHVSRSVAVNCVRRVARRSVSPYTAAIKRRFRCCSSVVEHSLGKGEVESSIPSSSTTLFKRLRAASGQAYPAVASARHGSRPAVADRGATGPAFVAKVFSLMGAIATV